MKEDGIRAILQRCQATRELIQFHRWADQPDIFLVGFVGELDKDRVLFHEVDPDGKPDGETWVPLSEIRALGYRSAYLESLAELFRDDEWQKTSFHGIQKRGRKTMVELLTQAFIEQQAVTIQFHDQEDRARGIVRELFKDSFLLEAIVDHGTNDGFYLYPYDRLKSVRMGSASEAAMTRFFAKRGTAAS